MFSYFAAPTSSFALSEAMNVHLRTHLMKLRTLSCRRHLHLLMENLFPMEAPIPSST